MEISVTIRIGWNTKRRAHNNKSIIVELVSAAKRVWCIRGSNPKTSSKNLVWMFLFSGKMIEKKMKYVLRFNQPILHMHYSVVNTSSIILILFGFVYANGGENEENHGSLYLLLARRGKQQHNQTT